MEVIPAIDLRQGGAVRLLQGDPDQTFQYGDPVAAARRWQAEGARRLHVVDLDGAFAGRPVHLDTAREIAQATGLPIQYGGGLRDLEAAEEALQSEERRVGKEWRERGARDNQQQSKDELSKGSREASG